MGDATSKKRVEKLLTIHEENIAFPQMNPTIKMEIHWSAKKSISLLILLLDKAPNNSGKNAREIKHNYRPKKNPK